MSTTNLRAAAFLAEQARLDFRRGGASKVRCLPPNRACGNRCIPPNWDCRLRGEGNDPHLRAAGTGVDPVAGLASLQRGVTSIARGATKLSFSDLESGRRSLARGTAKLYPGDLKKKEQAKKAVYKYAMWVLTPVAIGVGAALTHKGLKSFKIYRNGVGADIDNTFREVTDKIARNTPFGIGEGIRAREAAGRSGLASVRSTELAKRETLGSRTATSTTFLQSTSARRNPKAGDGSAAINKALEAAKTNTTSVDEWYNRSLSAFWGVKRSGDLQKIAGDIGEGSLYSIDSTNTLLARSLGLRGTDGRPLELPGTDLTGESRQVRALIRSRIAAERENIAVGMRQASLNPKDAGEVQEYLRRNAFEWQTGDVDVDNELSKTIVNTMTGNDDIRMADEFYRRTVKQFDTYYRDINDLVTNTPGLTTLNARQRQLYQDAVRGHAKYLTGTMDFDMPIEGSGSIALLKKVYYRRRVVGKTARYATVTLTDTELATVAQELGIDIKNRPPFSLERAINEHFEEKSRSMWDFPRARVKPKIVVRRYQAPATEAKLQITHQEVTTPTPTPEVANPRPARRRKIPEAQMIKDLIKAGYSEEEARVKITEYKAALEAKEAARQARGDSEDWTSRDEAHFQTWIHLDKRCGKSYIPDNKKCTKSATPTAAAKTATVLAAVGAVAATAAVASDPKLQQRVRVQARLISRGGTKALRDALVIGGHGAVEGMSSKQVKEGLNRLPQSFQEPARKLLGKAKQSAAAMALKAEGYSIQDIDIVNNYSTWKDKRGTLISVGSYGDSLVTYVSRSSHDWNNKRVYNIGFNVDHNFDATRAIPSEQAKSITGAVRQMTENHLTKIKDGVLATFPWDGDEYGAKRRAIYSRAGFNNISGEDSQWALVQKGKIKKMTTSEAFLYLAESGERDAPIYSPTKKRTA
jgi:hypothetical protein